jgi:hypothetical protein
MIQFASSRDKRPVLVLGLSYELSQAMQAQIIARRRLHRLHAIVPERLEQIDRSEKHMESQHYKE